MLRRRDIVQPVQADGTRVLRVGGGVHGRGRGGRGCGGGCVVGRRLCGTRGEGEATSVERKSQLGGSAETLASILLRQINRRLLLLTSRLGVHSIEKHTHTQRSTQVSS